MAKDVNIGILEGSSDFATVYTLPAVNETYHPSYRQLRGPMKLLPGPMKLLLGLLKLRLGWR